MKTFLPLFLAVLVAFSPALRAAPGDLDPGFVANTSSSSFARAIAVQPDGKILVGGNFTSIGGTTRNALARLNANGSLDATFNPDVTGVVNAILVLDDGQIVIAGAFTAVGGTARANLARLSATGALDLSFSTETNSTVACLALQADGKILFGGVFTSVSGTARTRLARVNADGSLDSAFNPSINQHVLSIAVQPDGKILLGGNFFTVAGASRSGAARLNADGSLDAFNANVSGSLESIAVQPDGKVLLGGNVFSTVGGVARDRIARVHADGSLDTTFNPGAFGGVFSLALQTDGELVYGGFFTSSGGTARQRLARLNADATLDAGFAPNVDAGIYGVALDGTGRILLAGEYAQIGGTLRNRLARLENDPATQTLTVPSATTVQWLRGGSAPESFRISFDLSTDGGTTWSPLGMGTRITGGWTLAGLTLPASGHLRARARTVSGQGNGSSGLVEQIVEFTVPVPEIEVAGGTTPTVILTGDTAPTVPKGTEFGSVATAGNTAQALAYTIRNTGAAALTVTSVTSDNPEFAVSGFTPGQILPSANTPFTVTFNPAVAGPRSATLTVASDDADEAAYTFLVSGTGVGAPEIEVRVGTLPVITLGDINPDAGDGTYFGNFPFSGTQTAPRTFTVHNVGDAALTITALNPGGSNPSDFPFGTLSATLPATVPAGGTFTFDVTFDPSGQGARSAWITVVNSDSDEGNYLFAVGGFATTPPAMVVRGLSININNGDFNPGSVGNHTYFQDVPTCGTPVTHTFTIWNFGTDTLQLTGSPVVAKGGAHPGDFTIGQPASTSILAGGWLDFTVTFTPADAGLRTATLSLATNDPLATPYTFGIAGNGTGPELELTGAGATLITTPDISPTTTDGTDLGTVAVAGNATLTQTFTIKNTGSAPLVISSITWTAQDVFTLSGFTAGSIAPGASQTFTVTFDPIAPGARLSDLTINTNDCNEGTAAFVVKGTGLGAPEITVRGGALFPVIAQADTQPESADGTLFPVQALTAGASVPHTFRIHNDGDATLTVSGVTSDNPEFIPSNFTPGSVAPGAYVTFDVSFDPAVVGTRTATISIANNDADEAPATFLVAGNGGNADLSISGNSVIIADGDSTPTGDDATAFFDRLVCAPGATEHTFTLRNTGSAPVRITAFGKSGAHPGDFTINAPTLPLDLAGPGGIATFTVAFDPSALGPRTAVIEVTHDGPGGPVYNFTVSGEGTGPEISITGAAGTLITTPDGSPSTPDGTDLGTVAVAGNATLTQVFTIHNSGNAPLVISSLTWSDQTVFTVTGFTSGTIAPGDSQTFTVTFDPTVPGPRMSDLTINSNDCDESAATFVVRGTGAGAPVMVVRGAGNGIADGDTSPTGFDLTHFDNVALCYGTPVTHKFYIHNTGTDPLLLTGTPVVQINGVNATEFVPTTPPALTNIPAGGQTSFDVTFTPTALGTRHATVSIAFNDPSLSPYEFAIAGFGVAPEIAVIGGPAPGQSITSGTTVPLAAEGTDFGNVALGSSLGHAFTLVNSGTYFLSLTGTPDKIAVSGAHPGDFKVTPLSLPNFVNANSNTPFTITFAPLGTGVRTALITIQNTDCDEGTFTFVVRGNGTGAPDIRVSGLGFEITDGDLSPELPPGDDTDFGDVLWNGTAFAQHTFTITNVGASNLHLNGTPFIVSSNGTQSPDFVVSAPGPIVTLAPFAFTTFTVTFDPSGPGTRTATIQIPSDDPDEPLYTFAIRGNGTEPPLPKARIEVFGNQTLIADGATSAIAPDHTLFPNTLALGAVTSQRTFTIVNNGGAALTINGISVSGGHASNFTTPQLTSPITILGGGGVHAFTVTFDPSVANFRSTTVLIDHSIATDDYDFRIGGLGTLGSAVAPEIHITGNALTILNGDLFARPADHTAFGQVPVNGGTVERTFTIHNTGPGTLSVTGVTPLGGQAGDFTVTQLPAASVAPLTGTTTFKVTFNPSGVGLRSTNIVVVNNDTNEALYKFVVSGTGKWNYTGGGFGWGGSLGGTAWVPLTDLGTGTTTLHPFGGSAVSLGGPRSVAWGDNTFGQLGNGSTTARSTPAAVATTGLLAGQTVVDLAAGQNHSVALCADGTLVAWGQGTAGQLGHGTLTDSLVPVAVTRTGPLAGKTIVALAAGQAHTLALCTDGTLVAWGVNASGQLGNNSTAASAVPVLVSATGALAGKTVTAIAAGDQHSVARCSDGTVVTWGANAFGQLGSGSTTSSPVPVAVTLAGKTVVGLAAGAAHTLAACSDGTVFAWGRNHAGQLGDGTLTDRLAPVAVTTTGALAGKVVVTLATGAAHTVALCSDDTLVAWGDNSSGQLGDGTRTTRTAPVLVNRAGTFGTLPIIALAAGAQHSVALTADSRLSAWGANGAGQLGIGDTATRLTPTPVALGVLAPGAQFSRLVAGASAHRTLALAAEPAPSLRLAGPTQDIFNAPGLSAPGDDTDFGRVVINSGTATRSFTLTNTGGAPLTFSGTPRAVVGGPHAAEFAVATQPASPVAPAGTTTLVVTFAPTAVGARTATVTLSTDDPAQPTFAFSLTGTGTTTGSLDGGPNSGANNVIFTTAVQPDGKNVLGGNFTRLGSPVVNRAARFETDGSLDLGFDPNVDGFVTATLVQADGAIVLGGQFTTVGGVARNRLARVAADGTLDPTFNPDADGAISALALQPDGKLIVAGHFATVGGVARGKIARLHPDGSLDTAFNPNANRAVYTALVQADGKILLGGNFDNVGGTTRQRIARVLADGTLDATFDPAPTSDVTSLVLQPDGKIVLAGQFMAVAGVPRNRLARLHADGSLDPTFDPNVDSAVYTLAAQADGKLLLGGAFNAVGGVTRTRLARIHADGTLDAAFTASADDDVVFSTALQADGKIVLAGYFTSVNSTARTFFARLDNDPAPQSLAATSASRVQWLRGGASPEVHQVTFELSVDGGATWTSLGAGTRLAAGGGWEKTGLALSGVGKIRARARTLGGAYTGSSGLVEAIATFGLPSAPMISAPPLAQTVALGGTATFAVVATGNPAPTFQWFKGNAAGNNPIAGATGATLTLTNVQTSAAASYSVVVTNSAGSVTSSGAVLTVSAAAVAPAITAQPVGQTVTAGGSVTFSVTATGNPAPTYQWRKATVAISGATRASLVLAPVAAVDAGTYDVVVTNSAGSVTSSAAPLVVNVPPAISVQPASVGAGTGTGVVFTVTATGTGPLAYQWSKDGTPLPGATAATLSLPAVTAAANGAYRVTVTNVAGSVVSDPAALAVFDAFPTHAVAGPGYTAGGTVTITNTLTYSDATSSLGWQVLLPDGWTYASGGGNEGNVRPIPGTSSLLEWAWTTVPGSPISFTYTLNVPAGTTGDRSLTALALIRQGAGLGQILAKPDPLVVSRVTTHSADTNRDSALDLVELTRVIALYNARNGSIRTGAYRVDATGEDGFAPDATRTAAAVVSLTRYHHGDTNHDARFSLVELTRMIELYNTRSGTTRTGQYRVAPGTEDGFAPGP